MVLFSKALFHSQGRGHAVPTIIRFAFHTSQITGRRRDTGMAGGMAIQSKTAYLMTDLNLASHL